MKATSIIKPLNWKGISDRHWDERAFRGEFGEQIVKELLRSDGLRLVKQQDRAPGLPDFRIDGTSIFIEVKTHKTEKPPIWQESTFRMMRKIGWTIYIAQPKLDFDGMAGHVTCHSINWYNYTDNGKLETLEKMPDFGKNL